MKVEERSGSGSELFLQKRKKRKLCSLFNRGMQFASRIREQAI